MSAGRIPRDATGNSIPHTEQPGTARKSGSSENAPASFLRGSGRRASGNVRIQRKLRSDASVAKVSTAKGSV